MGRWVGSTVLAIGIGFLIPAALSAPSFAQIEGDRPAHFGITQDRTLPVPGNFRGTNFVSGMATLVNTATLDFGGYRVPIRGLSPVDTPEALGSARAYLEANLAIVECRGEPWHLDKDCRLIVRGIDLGEVFVLSGLATAKPYASAKIKAAENHAREARSGVWALQP